MKYTLLLLPVLFLVNCTSPQKPLNAKVDAKGGYKDLKLETPLSALDGKVNMKLTLDNQCEATKKFEITTGKYLEVGPITFDKVELEYILDTLSTISLYKHNSLEFINLAGIYTSEFGAPTETKTNQVNGYDRPTNIWRGNKIFIEMNQGVLDISDLNVVYKSNLGTYRWLQEYQKCEKRKLEKGKADL